MDSASVSNPCIYTCNYYFIACNIVIKRSFTKVWGIYKQSRKENCAKSTLNGLIGRVRATESSTNDFRGTSLPNYDFVACHLLTLLLISRCRKTALHRLAWNRESPELSAYQSLVSICDCQAEQKPDMFALKLKFILLPQLIATLNNYACLLPPLANVDWSAFPECFLATM